MKVGTLRLPRFLFELQLLKRQAAVASHVPEEHKEQAHRWTGFLPWLLPCLVSLPFVWTYVYWLMVWRR